MASFGKSRRGSPMMTYLNGKTKWMLEKEILVQEKSRDPQEASFLAEILVRNERMGVAT